MDVAEIWKRYKCDPTDVEMRNRLIDQYMPLVRKHAGQIANRFRSAVIEFDDLVSAGFFGMLDAIEAFDPNRGIKFEAFSALRIRGAMLDESRRLDQVSRLTRTREKQRVAMVEQLRDELGRQPTDDEVATELGPSRQIAVPSVVSMDQLIEDKNSESKGRSLRDNFLDREDPPDRRMASSDQLSVIVQSLSQVERMIILCYYYEHMSMREILPKLSTFRNHEFHKSTAKSSRGWKRTWHIDATNFSRSERC